MSQIKNMQIQAEGEDNVHLLFASTTLGMLDMIEKGIIELLEDYEEEVVIGYKKSPLF